jgi:hypothetical protein
MKFLLDNTCEMGKKFSYYAGQDCGQLLTPLTRFTRWADDYAIDNGCFRGLDRQAFAALLERERGHADKCLFVCCPDVVASGRRTLELWRRRDQFVPACYRIALVAQDGIEEMEIPWHELDAIFIGGNDPWKDSKESQDIVRTAKILGKHVHIGRVNTRARFELFSELGADTCDGSGISINPHNAEQIFRKKQMLLSEVGIS